MFYNTDGSGHHRNSIVYEIQEEMMIITVEQK